LVNIKINFAVVGIYIVKTISDPLHLVTVKCYCNAEGIFLPVRMLWRWLPHALWHLLFWYEFIDVSQQRSTLSQPSMLLALLKHMKPI